jgi:ABC-type Zn2+ transport system substrate-binding protein/surface adhesin
MIDLSDDDENGDGENADDSIRFNCEFDSNVIDESDSHSEKHFDPRISISPAIVKFVAKTRQGSLWSESSSI